MRTLVIGLGNVSAGYDLGSSSPIIKSHLRAMMEFSKKNDVVIEISGVDPSPLARKRVVDYFPDVKVFESIRQLDKEHFDLVFVCCPIPQFKSVVEDICKYLKPTRIFLEKPGASNKSDALDIEKLLTLNDFEFFVGYPRRVLRSSQLIESLISENPGKYHVKIEYSGTPINILSHFLDLVEWWFGPFSILESSSDRSLMTFASRTLSLSTRQTAPDNAHDHIIEIRGPISLNYKFGGKKVEIMRSGSVNSLDFDLEITEQIKYSNWAALDWALAQKNPKFPNHFSPSMLGFLELF